MGNPANIIKKDDSAAILPAPYIAFVSLSSPKNKDMKIENRSSHEHDPSQRSKWNC